MQTITLRSTVRRQEGILQNSLSDRESVMLDLERGRYFGLQDVGHSIWDELERPIGVRDLCARLQLRFDVDEDTCQTEVLTFLEKLASQGLIDVHEADANP